ncbi:Acyl-CoA dehydrogenase [Oceanospirillum multiglobuliferum]|uniref:3-methylmercaptopropionyl-CoA dehydrogenase n=1 Tax=Oceanospirillum multiglobuliferum TaxID=64969 RepID=A0A1T4KF80_9GAMM|nr:acyl-CoA dehydrogenase [Oceanospirillum multiglobuliferum]OPX56012.1 acyl-CoA dehydrogenase [Oceanospirillum multiglobuliferum]SJZ41079.1 Acyl-CoA dehydrogenase [Oceanospirillum multiglobuliferum]
MTDYIAPLDDMNFVLNTLVDFEHLAELTDNTDASSDLVAAILEEAGKLSSSVIAPLNRTGDLAGVQLTEQNEVVVPTGFKEAYQAYVEGGWGSLQFNPQYGGQGLPFVLAIAVQEMWHSANMAWGLCPLLSQGAVEAIAANASPVLCERFLPKMISGEWSGTMNLTEPQAGSDLAAINTKAIPESEHYRITGQKIFITWGEHPMADNIVHLVLARLPDAPAGVKGISLFLVPKFLVNADGSLGARNACKAISLEHKLGIHASPTCVMSYGDNEGAIGYLVGEENRGLACMFTMMNNARLTVGLQGVSIAERAYQQAKEYALERVQGVAIGRDKAGPIIEHPDVRRMLMTMTSLTQAARALAYTACKEVDLVEAELPDAEKQRHQRRLGLLTPLVKGWCTEIAQEVTSLAVQVHGGMGFIEETGIAQHFRDARILPIYEGTNGIQAMDLVGRKLSFDQGQAVTELLEEIDSSIAQIQPYGALTAGHIQRFSSAANALRQASQTLLNSTDKATPAALAFNYLMLSSYVVAGWQMLIAADKANNQLKLEANQPFYQAKVLSGAFFLDQLLPRYHGYFESINNGAVSTLELPIDWF